MKVWLWEVPALIFLLAAIIIIQDLVAGFLIIAYGGCKLFQGRASK